MLIAFLSKKSGFRENSKNLKSGRGATAGGPENDVFRYISNPSGNVIGIETKKGGEFGHMSAHSCAALSHI